MSYNKCSLQGRLTSDVDLKPVGNTNKAEFSVACTRNYKNGDERKTDFIPCEAWRGTAEFIAKYFGKGNPIIVEGPIEIEPYTDKEGKNRRAFHLKVDNVCFVDGAGKEKGGNGGAAEHTAAPAVSSQAPATQQPPYDGDPYDEDGDLPF